MHRRGALAPRVHTLGHAHRLLGGGTRPTLGGRSCSQHPAPQEPARETAAPPADGRWRFNTAPFQGTWAFLLFLRPRNPVKAREAPFSLPCVVLFGPFPPYVSSFLRGVWRRGGAGSAAPGHTRPAPSRTE